MTTDHYACRCGHQTPQPRPRPRLWKFVCTGCGVRFQINMERKQ